MRKERDFPFVNQKVKLKGEIPTDEDGLMFLPPILWEKVLLKIRKRDQQKFWRFLGTLFRTKPKKRPMAVYKKKKPEQIIWCNPD